MAMSRILFLLFSSLLMPGLLSSNKNELPDRKLGDHIHPRILLLEGENEVILTDEGKVLKLKVLEPDNLQMKTWSTAPTNNYDAENPGTIIVGFECEIPANAKMRT
jgi:hypothetical protein